MIARNLLLFLALAAIGLAGQQLVAGEGRGDVSYILGAAAYALVVAGIPALVFLVPGLLFIAAADQKLPPVLLYVVAVLVSVLAFAPFVFVTNGDVDVIPLGVAALAYAVLLRPRARAVTPAAS